MTAKELREKRAALAKQIRALADKANNEKRDFSSEEKGNWEQVNKDYDDHTRQIDLAERAEKVEAEQRQLDTRQIPGRDNVDKPGEGEDRSGQPTQEDRALAVQAWFRHQSGLDLDERHTDAAKRCGVHVRRNYLDLQIGSTADVRAAQLARLEGRALSGVTANKGGALVADTLLSNLETNLLTFGGVRQVAEVMRTETGGEQTWPTMDDTSNEGELIGENNETDDDQEPSVGGVSWHAYLYSSKILRIPVSLLEDSAFDLNSKVGGMLGERIGRKQNRHFTTGDAAKKPKGIVTAATLGVTTAGAAAITADEILNLIHSVDPAYRIGAGFMFHDAVLLAIRKLKDNNGQYLWASALKEGTPDRLATYPLTINQAMDSTVTTTKKTMLFGQLNKYKIRDVRAIRVRRLVERYAEFDQEAFVAFMRSDGNLLDAGTAPVKYMQQA